MKKFLIQAATILIFNVFGWFIASGVVFLEFLMKPYTGFGRFVEYWGTHLAFILFISIVVLILTDDIISDKKRTESRK